MVTRAVVTMILRIVRHCISPTPQFSYMSRTGIGRQRYNVLLMQGTTVHRCSMVTNVVQVARSSAFSGSGIQVFSEETSKVVIKRTVVLGFGPEWLHRSRLLYKCASTAGERGGVGIPFHEMSRKEFRGFGPKFGPDSRAPYFCDHRFTCLAYTIVIVFICCPLAKISFERGNKSHVPARCR